MADGNQHAFHLPTLKAASRLRAGEIAVDLFAGGGGASTALEQALDRPVDIAINHNPWAVSMHAANHPYTRHLCEDIFEADPRAEVGSRAVGWLHASPDCTHFSQAAGGQPRSRVTRALSWAVLKWAGTVRPRIISLENVHQILKWGPLIAKRCKSTGRVLRLDGTVAGPGERVPLDQQFLIPDKRQQGRTWDQFIAALRALGYAVEWKRLKACDYGAGTSRDRLFLIARCDGEPIVWPEASHGPGRGAPYVTAADCIDWSIGCPSIFTRAKPLADATLRRIARGIRRYVLDAAEPFIVPNNTNNSPKRAGEPPPTVTTCHGRNLLVSPSIVQCSNASANGVATSADPLGTVTAWPKGGSHALASAMLVQAAHGEGRPGGVQRWGSGVRSVDDPAGTVTASGSGGYAVAAASLVKFRGDSDGSDLQEPAPTITSRAGAARPAGAAHAMGVMTAFLEQAAGGPNSNTSRPRATRFGVVECQLSPEHEAGALQVAGFLLRYYGTGGQLADLTDPAHAITTKDRLALVTVTIRGTPYVIVDIGLRMLQRHELFRAQGFPADYIIDRTADGRALSVSRSVVMVGNSVSPPPLRAIVAANLDPAQPARRVA